MIGARVGRQCRAGDYRHQQCVRSAGMSLVVLIMMVVGAIPAGAEPSPDLRRELELLKAQMERSRTQMEQDRQRIEQLERQLQSVEAKGEQKSKEMEEQIAGRLLNRSTFGEYIDRFAGEHRFQLTGYGTAAFEWQERTNTNTFRSSLNPIFLYRLSDRLLFEGELELKLEDTETSADIEYAQADYLLNDYVTLTAGKFLLPFGEFIERLHPTWINKLVTHPLPFREGDEGGLLAFTNVGVQARGAVPLGYGDGAFGEYAVYVTNGPRFASTARGALMDNNNTDQNRGKGYGARIGIEPLPFDYGLGRLRLGASAFDGKWDENGKLWFTAWGFDSVYQNGLFDLRGEYLQLHRNMPTGMPDDRREGWYIQAAYRLAQVAIPYLDRTELVVRYSGQNQNALTPADIEEGFLRKPRQVALGLDYWIAPSVVWKLEYDRDVPSGASDRSAIRTQFAVGF